MSDPKRLFHSLQHRFRGELITPVHAGYDDVRALYNGLIDKRPEAIVRCRDADDVVGALRLARESGLPVAVRGGGHNGAGLGSVDGGLVVDLSCMKQVSVDPTTRTVSVSPGCTQAEVDAATYEHGLAVPAGIVGSTGIAGLTLGGGHGYLSRQHGLTVDNLREAEIVLADGRKIVASATENEDLFWGLRGGGGNFGVVTRFTFRAHPIATVYGGPIFWELEHARTVLEFYREYLPTAPRRLCPFFGVKRIPSAPAFPEALWGRLVCAIIGCYDGPASDGMRAIDVIRKALPPPLIDAMQQIPFPAMQGLFDPLLPKGLGWYWKGDFVKELTDRAIDVHVEHAGRLPPGPSIMHLYPIDGAVHDLPSDATAFGCRDARWSMVIAGITPALDDSATATRWAKDYFAALHPMNTGGGYVNFMMEDEGRARIRAAYGKNYERLTQVKAKYDPLNFFRVNQNIPPAATREAAS
jgi:FAD/FMN-containing dehydrogenase